MFQKVDRQAGVESAQINQTAVAVLANESAGRTGERACNDYDLHRESHDRAILISTSIRFRRSASRIERA